LGQEGVVAPLCQNPPGTEHQNQRGSTTRKWFNYDGTENPKDFGGDPTKEGSTGGEKKILKTRTLPKPGSDTVGGNIGLTGTTRCQIVPSKREKMPGRGTPLKQNKIGTQHELGIMGGTSQSAEQSKQPKPATW